MVPVLGGIKLHDLHANVAGNFEGFPPIIVHDVWLGVIK